MTIYGRVSPDGLILETADCVDADDLAKRFHASLVSQFVELPDDAARGDNFLNGVLTPAPAEPESEEPADPVVIRKVPAAEFWSALTRAERIAVRGSADAEVEDFRSQLETVGHVDLDDADDQALFARLVTEGVLTQASLDAVNALR